MLLSFTLIAVTSLMTSSVSAVITHYKTDKECATQLAEIIDAGMVKVMEELHNIKTEMKDIKQKVNQLEIMNRQTLTSCHQCSSVVNCMKCQFCPSGWVQIGNNCYTVPRKRAKWEAAQEYCRSVNNSSLARIHDVDELERLIGYFHGYEVLFVGARAHDDMDFFWECHENEHNCHYQEVSEDLWDKQYSPVQPQDPKHQPFVAMYWRNGARGYLHDIPENWSEHFICKLTV